jgi:hypothetical protein
MSSKNNIIYHDMASTASASYTETTTDSTSISQVNPTMKKHSLEQDMRVEPVSKVPRLEPSRKCRNVILVE